MKSFLFMLSALTIASTIVYQAVTIECAAASRGSRPIELSLAGFMPLSDVNMVYADKWASQVEAKCNGRVKINRFWAQTLCKAQDTYNAVRTGVVDIGLSAQSYQDQAIDQFCLSVGMGLPFGFRSNEAIGRCFRDLYDKIPAFRDEYKAVKNLFIWVPGLFQIHTIKKEVRLPDDMKGLQIRSPGGVVTEVIKAWGGTPVSMPMSEAYMALQKGIVGGIVAPYQVIKDIKMGELIKYTNEGNYCTNPFLFIMNKSKYQSLPQDIQKIIDETSYEWWVTAGKLNDELDPSRKKWLIEEGAKIYAPQGHEAEQWRQKNKSIIDAWAKNLEAKGVPSAVTFAEEAFRIAHQ